MAKSYGTQIDALLHDYLHSDDMRERVSQAARLADAAVNAQLTPHIKTGEMIADSHAEATEFDAGYGMQVSTIYKTYFVALAAGRVRNREPGFKRGAGQRRKRGFKKSATYREVTKPSVFGEAVETFGREIEGI